MAATGKRKRSAANSQSDEDRDGAVWVLGEDSGSAEELSLADSSYSEDAESGTERISKPKEVTISCVISKNFLTQFLT